MNEENPIFGHQIDNVKVLCEYFSEVLVLTGESKYGVPADNCKVVSYEWIAGERAKSTLRFLRIFIGVIFNFKPNLVFSHMTEVQSALIAPLLRITPIRHYLWYAHKSKSIYLRWCNFWINGIITSTDGSCPIRSKKVFVVGQAIDPKLFPFAKRDFSKKNRVIHTGRLDPSKNIELIISVFNECFKKDKEATLTFVGEPSTSAAFLYIKNLRNRFANEIEDGRLIFLGNFPRTKLFNLLNKSDVFLHGFQGSLDKTVVEATLMGLPVITLNQEYLRQFGRWSLDDSKSINLRDELLAYLNLEPADIELICEEKRRIALAKHSLQNWGKRVFEVLQ